jgi:hypothetical protein
MKKIFTILFLGSILIGKSQSSIEVKDMTSTLGVPANWTVSLGTTAGNTTSRTFDIKNIGSTTNTYVVIRYDVSLHSSAVAYYCFAGTCYGNTTFISPTPLILTAGQSASQYTAQYTTLTTDLDEAPTVGVSRVKYTFRNVSNVNDSLQFTLIYNNPAAGVKELNNAVSRLEIAPNPANEMVNLSFNFKGTGIGELTVVNALGQSLLNKSIALTEGKNNVSFNVSELPQGVYFVRIKNGEAITTKRLVVN